MLTKLVRQWKVDANVVPIIFAIRAGGAYEAVLASEGAVILHPRSVVKLLSILRSSGPKKIVGWMYHGCAIATICRMFARTAQLFWFIRCSDVKGIPFSTRFLRACLARISWLPCQIVYNSSSGAIYHQKVGFRGRSVVIPNGFDTRRFAPDPEKRAAMRRRLAIPSDRLLGVTVANYTPSKDYISLLHALALAHSRGFCYTWLLCGRGVDHDNKELVRCVQELGLEGQVKFLGAIEDPEHVYQAADLAALISHSEGFPNTVGEAMACGLPCIVSDVGDCRAIVGNAGFVTQRNNREAIATALAEYAGLGDGQRALLSNQARERVVKLFKLEANAKTVLTVING